jgi:hypothetical protein
VNWIATLRITPTAPVNVLEVVVSVVVDWSQVSLHGDSRINIDDAPVEELVYTDR